MLRIYGLLIIGFIISSTSMASMPNEADVEADRLIYIDRPISQGTIRPVYKALEEMSYKSDKPISIVINSPGGEVVAGFSFVNLMSNVKARGIRIDCYVMDMAASMAFQILTQCSRRMALTNSFLLFHGVRVHYEGPLTVAQARAYAEDLARIDEIITSQLVDTLGISRDICDNHFENETLFSGTQLRRLSPDFIWTAKAYPILHTMLPKAVRMRELNLFDMLFGGSYIHVWDRGMELQGYTTSKHGSPAGGQ